MMTRSEIDLVQSSFVALQPVAAQVAALFYDRLFERDPAASLLFSADMAEQGHRLMVMIGRAVALLDHPAQLNAALHALGERHAGYGVTPAMYHSVGGALLDTLAAGLGPVFTPTMRQAWAAMYALVAQAMQACTAPA